MRRIVVFFLCICHGCILGSCLMAPCSKSQTYSETQVKNDTVFYYRSTPTKRNHTNDTLFYSWTKAGIIYSTQGHFFGRLLHGDYVVMVNNQMHESGSFKLGLKNDKWRYWQGNNLISFYTWKNGLLHGNYTIYDESGNIFEEGKFIRGKKKK